MLIVSMQSKWSWSLFKLKKDEVERYGNDFFPMSFQFRTIEDVYNLSFLFLWASPINKPKQETLKEIDPENIDGVKSGNTVNRKASTLYKNIFGFYLLLSEQLLESPYIVQSSVQKNERQGRYSTHPK